MLRFKLPGILFLGAGVAALGWWVLQPAARLPIGASPASPAPLVYPEAPDSTALTALQATVAGLLQRLEILEAEKALPSPSASPLAPAQPKAVFAPQTLFLGSGSTTQRDWTESGAQTWLDSADYPAGVKAVFEAGLSIIGGEAWARLKNKTTGSILASTEVFHNSSQTAWKTSPVFSLHSGSNLYVVEIRSSSDELVNLAGSRIKLFQ